MKKKFDRELSAKELATLPDGEIDYSDIPELSDAFFENAKILKPVSKEQITIRFDKDVLDWFKQDGRGYQSRMNSVLRAYVQTQQPDNWLNLRA